MIQVIVSDRGGADLVQNTISFLVLACWSAFGMVENIPKLKARYLTQTVKLELT